jgi:hypothetical protein
MTEEITKCVESQEGWEWFPYSGHFAAAKYCLFSLHTHVGYYCVSTVGHYIPPRREGDSSDDGHGRWQLQPIGSSVGSKEYFETNVLLLGDDGEPEEGALPEATRYPNASIATAGHIEACKAAQTMYDESEYVDEDDEENDLEGQMGEEF